MARRFVTPLESVGLGLVAGIVGSWVIDRFFSLTSGVAPKAQAEGFEPPEERQKHEGPSGTVARRFAEGLAQRETLTPAQVERGGRIVHFAYGAGWGALYGLARETFPALAGPVGGLGFGAAVGLASGSLLLPSFKLAPGPTKTPASMQAYQLAAHLAYGLGTQGAYGLLVRRPWLPVAAYFGLRGPVRRFTTRARVKGSLQGLRLAGKSVRYRPVRRAARAVAPYAARVALR